MNKYIQFLYGILFSGQMHENPVRFMCTHPWLEYALWGRCLHDLSWWVSSTQKHWVWGSPCNSSSPFTAANAALDNKPVFHWSSLLFVYFIIFFLLHSILHQSASVIHLKFFIPRSVSPLGLKLYVALFLTLFFLFGLLFFFFSSTKQKIVFQGEKLPTPCAFTLKCTSNWGMNVMNQWQNVSFWNTQEEGSSLIPFHHLSCFSHIHNQHFLFFLCWSSINV